jgi:hypothetical protein
MSLKTAMTNDMAVFFNTDEFAQAVTYAGSSINAIVTYKDNLGDQGPSKARLAELEVKVADVASPDYRDAVIIGSDTWRVRRVIEGDAYAWKLEIEIDKRAKL